MQSRFFVMQTPDWFGGEYQVVDRETGAVYHAYNNPTWAHWHCAIANDNIAGELAYQRLVVQIKLRFAELTAETYRMEQDQESEVRALRDQFPIRSSVGYEEYTKAYQALRAQHQTTTAKLADEHKARRAAIQALGHSATERYQRLMKPQSALFFCPPEWERQFEKTWDPYDTTEDALLDDPLFAEIDTLIALRPDATSDTSFAPPVISAAGNAG